MPLRPAPRPGRRGGARATTLAERPRFFEARQPQLGSLETDLRVGPGPLRCRRGAAVGPPATAERLARKPASSERVLKLTNAKSGA